MKLTTKKLENKMDAMYEMIDVLSGELGYIAGATRESTKSYEKIRVAGIEKEEKIQKLANLLRKSFVENNTHTDY